MSRTATNGDRELVLLVDDNPTNLQVLFEALEEQGPELLVARSGEEAIELARAARPALILLDIQMPGIDGYETCRRLRASEDTRDSVVIFMSALDDTEAKVRGLQIGAVDYITKPFQTEEVIARVGTHLTLRRLGLELRESKDRAERLLLNVLPATIAERLKQGESSIADEYPDATVLQANVVGIDDTAGRMTIGEVVALLNDVFSKFDALAETYGVEKVKTFGDVYIGVAGVPEPRADHAEAVAEMALQMQREATQLCDLAQGRGSIGLRLGISSGPVVAGVIGRTKFSWDVWGETVKLAAAMERFGMPGAIQVAEATYRRLADKFLFEDRGEYYIEGQGEIRTYLLTGKL